jgi:hypothetical protein
MLPILPRGESPRPLTHLRRARSIPALNPQTFFEAKFAPWSGVDRGFSFAPLTPPQHARTHRSADLHTVRATNRPLRPLGHSRGLFRDDGTAALTLIPAACRVGRGGSEKAPREETRPPESHYPGGLFPPAGSSEVVTNSASTSSL